MNRVTVVLCSGAHGGAGPDATALLAALAHDGVPAEMVADLCARPEAMVEIVRSTGAERLVLARCERATRVGEIQAWARKAGLDPFAIQIVPLGARSLTAARAAVVAAVAGARVCDETDPAHLRMRFQGEPISRRALLRLAPLTYDPVAAVEDRACLGTTRCGICVKACPVAVVSGSEARPVIDKAACTGCGVCVTACPAGAISLPAGSLKSYEASLATLIACAPGAGVVIACERSAPLLDAAPLASPDGADVWVPFEVPCLGMVTPGWVLQTLAAGAPAVALLPCGDGCHPGHEDPVDARARYCVSILSAAGVADALRRARILPLDPARLAEELGTPPSPLPRVGERLTLTEPVATAEALLRFSSDSAIAVRDDASPLGVVRIDHIACTACGACAEACPTSALTLRRADHEVSLTFDPSACLGCARCEPACPERALIVRRETSVAALARGPVAVKTGRVRGCRMCGRPVAPEAMLARIRGLLAGESDPLLRTLTELCPDCRAVAPAPI